MADKKLSDLTAADNIQDTDLFYVDQGGATPDRKASAAQLKAYGAVGGNGGGNAKRFLPFFFDTSVPWSRPGLDIGGEGDSFTMWLGIGGGAFGGGSTVSPATNFSPDDPGTGYIPGELVAIAGGTGTAATRLEITDTQVISAAIISGGAGGTPGPAQVTGTTGDGSLFILNITIGDEGNITSIDGIQNPGDYTTNPSNLSNEPVADASISGITGAIVSLVMGALIAIISDAGSYTAAPTNPAAQASSSGAGTGASWNLFYTRAATANDGSDGAPLVISADFPLDITLPNNTSSFLTCLLKPVGTPSWTITVGAAAVYGKIGSLGAAPLILYNSSLDKALVVAASCSGTGLWYVRQFTDASKFNWSNSPTNAAQGNASNNYFGWWSVENDGTNIILKFSGEGQAYSAAYQDRLDNFIMNVSHVGFGLERSSDYDAYSILWDWRET